MRPPAAAPEIDGALERHRLGDDDAAEASPASRRVGRHEVLGIHRVTREKCDALAGDARALEALPHGEERGAAEPGTFVDDEALRLSTLADCIELGVARRVLPIPGVTGRAHAEPLGIDAARAKARPHHGTEARADAANADDEHAAIERRPSGGRARIRSRIERVVRVALRSFEHDAIGKRKRVELASPARGVPRSGVPPGLGAGIGEAPDARSNGRRRAIAEIFQRRLELGRHHERRQQRGLLTRREGSAMSRTIGEAGRELTPQLEAGQRARSIAIDEHERQHSTDAPRDASTREADRTWHISPRCLGYQPVIACLCGNLVALSRTTRVDLPCGLTCARLLVSRRSDSLVHPRWRHDSR